MATTYNDNGGNTPNGSHLNFTYTFPVIKNADVKVALNGITQASTKYTVNSGVNPTRIEFNNTSIDSTLQESTGAPKTGVVVRVYRDTGLEDPADKRVTFQAGSAIRAQDLNNMYEHLIFSTQEEQNQLERITDDDVIPTAEIQVSKLKDGTARQVLQTDAAGTGVEWTSNVDVPGTLDVTSTAAFDSNVTIAGTTTAAAINASGAVGVDGNFDVNNNKFTVAASSGNTVIAGDLEVGGTFDVTGTSNYTGQQTVPGGALVKDIRVGLDGNNEVSTASGDLVLDSASGTVKVTDHFNVTGNADVDSNLNVDGTLTVDGTSTLTGNTSIGGTLTVTGTTNLASSSIGRAEIANDAIDGTKIDDDAINSEHYVDGSIDRVHLEADIIDSTKLADDAVRSEHIQANAVTDSEIATGTLDNRYFTETELTGGALDGRYFTETESDARYFNVSTGDTIKDGDAFPDNDTTIATTAAINDRIIDLVDDVGGFVPIANETSFPNANPDVNNGSGTLVSIKTLASNHTSNGSGVISISNGTVGNSTVTINGAENSTTYNAGYGMIVETTSTLNTYAFHRLVPKATEVTTVAGKATEIGRLGTAAAVEDLGILGTTAVVEDLALLGTSAVVDDMALLGTTACIADMATIADTSNLIANIGTVAGIQANVTTVAGNNSNVTTVASNISDVNNFADLYQIASSNPSTDGGGNSLAEGDLYFNTSADELKVWNGSAWQGGVTATGNFASVTGNTFTGDNKYNDGVKVLLGTGSDLEIFHDATNNQIKSVNGKVVITTTAGNADIEVTPHGSGVVKLDGLSWPTADGSNGQVLTTNGSGSLSFTTVAVGGATGTDYNDSVEVRWGTHNDLVISHDGSNSIIKDRGTGELRLEADAGGVRIQRANGNTGLFYNVGGQVELYFDNVKKLETIANGTNIVGNLGINRTGANRALDIETASNQNAFHINSIGTPANYYGRIADDGTTFLEIDSSKNLKLISDSGKVQLGASQDLQIFHNGTDSLIQAHTTGNIEMRARSNWIAKVNSTDGGAEDAIKALQNGAVELYFDNSKKFETTSTGLLMTGNAHGIELKSASANSGNFIKFSDHNASDDGRIQYEHSTNEFLFKAEGNWRTRLGTTYLKPETTNVFDLGTDSQRFKDVYVSNDIDLLDNSKLLIGTGDDLEIYHDGSNSVIRNVGTGDLFVESISGTKDTYIRGSRSVFIQSNSNENHAKFIQNGATELYFDGALKAQTTSTGFINYGNLHMNGDNRKVILGGGDDLQIYHDGTDSYINSRTGNLYLAPTTGTENGITVVPNGEIRLYHDNSKKFETTSSGVLVSGNVDAGTGNFLTDDNGKYFAGTGGDFELYHDGSNTYLNNSTGAVLFRNLSGDDLVLQTVSAENNIKCKPNNSVLLYYDNSTKLETRSYGVKQDDSVKHTWGNDDDLQIYHDGSHSRIKNATGALLLENTGECQINKGTSEWMAKFIPDGAVQLFYDNSEKFSTQSDGVSITGHLKPNSSNTYDLGSSGARWNNLYVNDMHFSNNPDNPNSVDGTWGDWTLQEGEEDIFMINNRSGKKYKMALTEVS